MIQNLNCWFRWFESNIPNTRVFITVAVLQKDKWSMKRSVTGNLPDYNNWAYHQSINYRSKYWNVSIHNFIDCLKSIFLEMEICRKKLYAHPIGEIRLSRKSACYYGHFCRYKMCFQEWRTLQENVNVYNVIIFHNNYHKHATIYTCTLDCSCT